MSHKPKPVDGSASRTAVAETPAPATAAGADAAPPSEAELTSVITADEALLQELEQRHAQATTLGDALPLEREIGGVEARIRRRRGELLVLRDATARAEAAAREAERLPHRQRLALLADVEVPAAAEQFKVALASL